MGEETYAETDGTEGGHGENVEPGVLEPLAKGGPGGHGVGLEAMATSALLIASSAISSNRRCRTIRGARLTVEEAHLCGVVSQSLSVLWLFTREISPLDRVPGRD